MEVVLVQRWSGKLVPAQKLTAKAPSDAEIRHWNVLLGQSVQRGQTLIRLVDPPLLAVQQATRAKVRRLQSALKTESVEVLRAELAETRARLELSRVRAELVTARALLERGLIAKLEGTALEQREQDAQMQLSTATRELEMARATSRLARQESVEELKVQMELASSQERRLAALEIVAPFDGRISWALPSETTQVRRDTEILTLESTGTIAVELQILRSPEVDHLFRLGAIVRLSMKDPLSGAASRDADRSVVDGTSSPMQLGLLLGRVDGLRGVSGPGFLSTESGGTSSITVHIAIDATQWRALDEQVRLRWAQGADVDVLTEQSTQAFRIPASAVIPHANKLFVFALAPDGKNWRRREVFGTAEQGSTYLIEKGLVDTDIVAKLR
ncbi:hypothetical protein WJ62_05670 [Burkholderia diffusa]|nr:hypothetical protein WJ62_05670 [Burkholderia diffusa]